jgi:hypothetical protein
MLIIEENIIFIQIIIVVFFVGIALTLLLLDYLERKDECNIVLRPIKLFEHTLKNENISNDTPQNIVANNNCSETDMVYNSRYIEKNNVVENAIHIEKDDKYKTERREETVTTCDNEIKSTNLPINRSQKKIIKADEADAENDLSELEKKNIEEKAMYLVKQFEKKEGRKVKDVSMYYTGYDIKSTDRDKKQRFIEVKGKARSGKIILTVNEWNTAKKFRNQYYLYIVENISLNKPRLKIIQDPYSKLTAIETKFQYILSRNNYISQANEVIPIDIIQKGSSANYIYSL